MNINLLMMINVCSFLNIEKGREIKNVFVISTKRRKCHNQANLSY